MARGGFGPEPVSARSGENLHFYSGLHVFQKISSIPPPDGVARMRRKDAGSRCLGGEDKDAQKKAGLRCCWA